MTVAEMIAKLSTMPEHLPVSFWAGEQIRDVVDVEHTRDMTSEGEYVVMLSSDDL